MSRVVAALPNEGRDALVALFEIGADTTSLKVLRDDEMLYDRDQAFGGSQLTQLISAPVRLLVRGGRSQEARRRPARRLRKTAILAPFVDSLSQEIGRALQYFFTSTPHHKVHYVMLAGGTATLPGLKDRVTELTGFASQVVNPFDQMQFGSAVRESRCAARGPVLPDGLRPGDAEVPAVILINLLPHREEKRRQRKRAYFVSPGGLRADRLGRGRCLVFGAGADDFGARVAQRVPERRRSTAWIRRSRTSPRCAPRSTP